MTNSLPEEKLILDKSIYCAEAVKLAAFVFSGRAVIKIKPGKSVSQVLISAKSSDLAAGGSEGQNSSSIMPLLGAEFLNEVLNQQCRIDLAKKNSKISSIIVTKALLSAAGEKAEDSRATQTRKAGSVKR